MPATNSASFTCRSARCASSAWTSMMNLQSSGRARQLVTILRLSTPAPHSLPGGGELGAEAHLTPTYVRYQSSQPHHDT
eukprot:1063253-Rhodomonas_salina.1